MSALRQGGRKIWYGALGVGAAGFGMALTTRKASSDSSGAVAVGSPTAVMDIGKRPLYSATDVREHGGGGEAGKSVWVTYKNGVYDITEFVDGHPGGEQILEAAGGPVEPFWALYAQHDQDFVRELLEEYRIGDLSDGVAIDSKDPYDAEPVRSSKLISRSEKPYNAEPGLGSLMKQVTPNELFYVRNHLPVPTVDESTYRLRILDVDGAEIANLSLSELHALPKHEVAATLQCAGNRRDEMHSVRSVRGGSWGGGAIGNAVWGGVLLTDVIPREKLDSVAHVIFEGLDIDPGNGTAYGASVPAGKGCKDLGIAGDVLLAYEMNGEPLPRDHGYPVRAVAPGVVGARSVKWLSKVQLSETESGSHWQRRDYKAFSPDVDWNNISDAMWDAAPSIQEAPVVSAVCEIAVIAGGAPETTRDTTREARVSGYAWSGGGRGIVRVDVSGDNGRTWTAAKLRPKPHGEVRNAVYDWTLWDARVVVDVDEDADAVIVCKAVDSAHNTQPDGMDGIWNLRGLLNNAWHRVHVKTEP